MHDQTSLMDDVLGSIRTIISTQGLPKVYLPHGRLLEVGSLWVPNDRRRWRLARIVAIDDLAREVTLENVVSRGRSTVKFHAFTIGTRGWSRA